MQKTELFAEIKTWRWAEVAGLFAVIFLKKHDEEHKKLMIEAINAVCSEEQIDEALEVLGRKDKDGKFSSKQNDK